MRWPLGLVASDAQRRQHGKMKKKLSIDARKHPKNLELNFVIIITPFQKIFLESI